jgi:hypothetical protein
VDKIPQIYIYGEGGIYLKFCMHTFQQRSIEGFLRPRGSIASCPLFRCPLHNWSQAMLQLAILENPSLTLIRWVEFDSYMYSASISLLPIVQKFSPLYSFNEFKNNWLSYPKYAPRYFSSRFSCCLDFSMAFHSRWYIS